MSLRRPAYVGAAFTGLVAAGLGFAGVAAAAPGDASPASTAPATADSAPVPVPLVNQPVDASGGLFGMRRGSVPTASTPDLRHVPFADRLPGVGVTPLPRQYDADHADTENSEDTGAADR